MYSCQRLIVSELWIQRTRKRALVGNENGPPKRAVELAETLNQKPLTLSRLPVTVFPTSEVVGTAAPRIAALIWAAVASGQVEA